MTPAHALNLSLWAGALLLLAGCDNRATPGAAMAERASAASQSAAPIARATPPAREDCLAVVWENQAKPDRVYDRAHDKANGGAISCATSSSASQFRDAIADLRLAAESRDKARILEQVGLPLLYIDASGNPKQLRSEAAVEAAFDRVFNEETLALLRRIDIGDMTVVPRQGGFFELGALWLVVPEPGARPRLLTVNQQALGEAAAAARKQAR